jgi:competence protein ComEA
MSNDEARAVAFLGVLLCLALVARYVNRPKPVTINAGAVDIEALRAAGQALAQNPPPRSKSRKKAASPAPQTATASSEPKAWTRPAWQRSASGTVSSADAASGTGPLNINRATEAELESLPGIGPAVAKRIVARRDSIGRFEKLEDLDAVKGIGPALLRKIEPLVTFR